MNLNDRLNIYINEGVIAHDKSTLYDLKANGYRIADVYYHNSVNGILSALAVKTMLKVYGIGVIWSSPILTGTAPPMIQKAINKILLVIVDINGDLMDIKISSDTDEYDLQVDIRDYFSPSDLDTIRNTTDDDIIRYGFRPIDVLRSAFGTEDILDIEKNYMAMGLTITKVLEELRGNDKFINSVVMESGSGLLSLYANVVSIAKRFGYTPPERDIAEIMETIYIQIDERFI
jgi:hypothetical protein